MSDGPAIVIADASGSSVAAVKPASTAAVGSDPALVVAVSPNTVVAVSDGGGSLTVDGAVTANIGTTGGLALDATLTSGSQSTKIVDGPNVLDVDATGRAAIQNPPNLDVSLSSRASEATVSTLLTEAEFESRIGDVSASPAANTVLGRLKGVFDEVVARLGTLGQKAMAGSTPVVVASDQSAIRVRGADAHGSPPTVDPVLVAGVDGSDIRRVLTDQSGRLWVRVFDEPTFVIRAAAVAIGNGKSMLSILNTGSEVVRLREVWIINSQTTAVTGVMADFRLHRITGHSGGTDLSSAFLVHDTSDSVPSGLTARTGATVSGASANPLRRALWSSDEYGPGTLDQEGLDHAIQTSFPFYRSASPMKPITIRQNQGIHLLQNTGSTAGSFDIVAVLSSGVL